MKSVFDKLNLRTQERRLVVIVGIVVFVVINVVFVYPIFGDYGKTMEKKRKAESTLKKYTDEVNRKARYDRQLRELETNGQIVGQEDQALQLQKDVASKAVLAGV